MNTKIKNMFNKVSDAVWPELLDFIPLLIPGSVGMILPFLGKVYFNYKGNEDIQKQIDDLKNKVATLDETKIKKIEAKIRNICKTYIFMQSETESGCAEIYSVGCFKIELLDNEYVIDCLEALNDALNGEYYFGELIDNMFYVDNAIIFNLLASQHRRDLDEALLEIEKIINENSDYTWKKTAIKKVVFY